MSVQETGSAQYQGLNKSELGNINCNNIVEQSLEQAKVDSSHDAIQRENPSLSGQQQDRQATDINIKQNCPTAPGENETASNPAAFTITFDDDKGSKRFGIRDSIRKFAPPKPHTIEKPRPAPKSSQECAYDSLVTAPGSLVPRRFQCDDSQTKLSKVSDSAKFLIDKMLNCEQQSASNTQSDVTREPKQLLKHSVDLSDDRSDNGTYVIGADPESDAARSKIDELFGVVKSAEACLLAESATRTNTGYSSMGKHSHLSGRRTTNQDASEPASCRHSSEQVTRPMPAKASPTTSSSSQNDRLSRTSRRSRNSSADRGSRVHSQHRPKRSTSQASRNSSHRDPSDAETRSSLSSLQNFNDRPAPTPVAPSQPSMRFNRTVALRRARLGLGEPILGSHAPAGTSASEMSMMSPLSAQGRQRSSHGTQRPHRDDHSSTSFSRDDGGRFSLRSKGFTTNARYCSSSARQHPSGSSRFQSPSISTYISPTPLVGTNGRNARAADSTNVSPMNVNLDDRSLLADSMLDQTDLHESDSDSTAHRLQYSLNTFDKMSIGSSRKPAMDKTSLDLGGFQYGNALDSLVVSAISSLSTRLSHSVCDVLVDQARKLPHDNEVRVIVEETIPQLMMDSGSPKSALIDRPLVCNDLSRTLKNLRKIEQMVDVIGLISSQLPCFAGSRMEDEVSVATSSRKDDRANSSSADNTARSLITARRPDDSDISGELNSVNEFSS